MAPLLETRDTWDSVWGLTLAASMLPSIAAVALSQVKVKHYTLKSVLAGRRTCPRGTSNRDRRVQA